MKGQRVKSMNACLLISLDTLAQLFELLFKVSPLLLKAQDEEAASVAGGHSVLTTRTFES